MALFLAGCCVWIAGRGQGPEHLFHAGAIDVAGTLAMTIALAVGQQAARQARLSLAWAARQCVPGGGEAR